MIDTEVLQSHTAVGLREISEIFGLVSFKTGEGVWHNGSGNAALQIAMAR